MLSKERVLEKIDVTLSTLSRKIGLEVILNEEYFREYESYFTFNYNSRSYLVDGVISDALVGNHMIIVSKVDGIMYKLYNKRIGVTNIDIQKSLKDGDIVEMNL